MNVFNAMGFFALGTVMGLMPHALPSWFPPDGADQDVRALWLESMGLVQALLGSGYLVRRFAVVPLIRWGALRRAAPKPAAVMLPDAGGISAR